jgi:hypothetical protein
VLTGRATTTTDAAPSARASFDGGARQPAPSAPPSHDQLLGGKPVAGYSRTNSGIRYRIFAYLDCYACPKPSWRRLKGVAPRADGTFRLLVPPGSRGTRYRATIAGPNLGRTLAPDASATTGSSLG